MRKNRAQFFALEKTPVFKCLQGPLLLYCALKGGRKHMRYFRITCIGSIHKYRYYSDITKRGMSQSRAGQRPKLPETQKSVYAI